MGLLDGLLGQVLGGMAQGGSGRHRCRISAALADWEASAGSPARAAAGGMPGLGGAAGGAAWLR